MLKNACALKDNDFVICILRTMKAKHIEPTDESVRLVEEYHARVFQNLRSYHVVSKKMRNDCFKLTRECKDWKKHFRKDKLMDSFTSEHHVQQSKQKGHFKKRSNLKVSKLAGDDDNDDSHVKHQNDKLPNA